MFLFCSMLILLLWAIQMIYFWRNSLGLSRWHANDFFHIACTKHKSFIFGQPLLSSQTKILSASIEWHFHLFQTCREADRKRKTNLSFSFTHLPRTFSLYIIDWLRITWSDEVTVAWNFMLTSSILFVTGVVALVRGRENGNTRQIWKFKFVIFKIDCIGV